MEDPVRLFTTAVMLGSAAYVVATNLNFRRQLPAMSARYRRQLVSTLDRDFSRRFDVEAGLASADRTVMCVGAMVAGALSGAIAGLLLDVALTLLGPRLADHGAFAAEVGAAFGALAFAVLAVEER